MLLKNITEKSMNIYIGDCIKSVSHSFLCFFYLFVCFVCFTGVLHSNIYIGRDFFCALILSNYGNTSWQNKKQNNRRRKQNKTKLVVMKDDALDKSEILF